VRITVVVGSPRREHGLSQVIVSEFAQAARDAGAAVAVEYLIDYNLEFCVHCCNTCFADGSCRIDEGINRLSAKIHESDALAIAYPVYVWLHNGLTAAFFDKYRRALIADQGENGKPAIAIAVAGNSGTGLFSSLKGLYSWMCTMQFRPLDPIPVSKYNYRSALRAAAAAGRRLATTQRDPFRTFARSAVTYDQLPVMDLGRIDEFRWLATNALQNATEELGQVVSSRPEIQAIREQLLIAERYACGIDPHQEAEAVMAAYTAAATLWGGSGWSWY
jgi:multimeric flavodoxin WrbA